jgi:hypothetical protein
VRKRVRETAWAVVTSQGFVTGGSPERAYRFRVYPNRYLATVGLDEVPKGAGHRVVRVTITEAPARRATATGRRKGKR